MSILQELKRKILQTLQSIQDQLNSSLRKLQSNTIGTFNQADLSQSEESNQITQPAEPVVTQSKHHLISASIDHLQTFLAHQTSLAKDERENLSAKLNGLDSLIQQKLYKKSPTINIHRNINPREIEHNLLSKADKSIFVAWSELLRNVLVLLPILLTWASLAVASSNYKFALTSLEIPEEQRIQMSQSPFLLLWEQNFNGYGHSSPIIPRPTFSEVATWDAAIILIAVILTLSLHWQLDLADTKRRTQASKVRHKLEIILWDISQLLSAEYVSKISLDPHLDAYAEHLIGGTEKLSEASKAIDTASNRLTRFESLASDLHQQQTTLLQTLNDLNSKVTALGEIANSATSNADTLRNTTDGLLSKFEKVANLLEADRQQATSFTAEMRKAAHDLKEDASATERAYQTFSEHIGDKLTSSSREISYKADLLSDKLAEHLQYFSDRINNSTENLGDDLHLVHSELKSLSKKGLSLPRTMSRRRRFIENILLPLEIVALISIAALMYFYLSNSSILS